jgi:hypothetical protein
MMMAMMDINVKGGLSAGEGEVKEKRLRGKED